MKKVIETSIKRRVTVAMFTLAVILFGFVSFTRLKINLLPDLTYPTLTIRTEYTGAAPAEIENLISKPIEEIVGVVKNVKQVSSISRSGQSDVVLEFAWGANMDHAILEVREKLDTLELPLEVQHPVLLRFDPALDPILRFGLFKEGGKDSKITYQEEELKSLRRFADEQIKKELESALGVAAVKISGGLEDEIQILIDQQKLSQLNIPISRISQILASENVNLSGGRLEEGSHQFLVRTLNQFKSLEEIGDVTVDYKDKRPIYLKDIAEIKHGFKERKAITRMKGTEAVEIAIYKEGDANTVSVARDVQQQLGRVNKILPKGIKLTKVYDQALFIQQAVDEVISAAMFGGILAVLILYFFLRHFWSTVIISLSIPVSVIATFNIMYASDLSLNIMSLGGIALGVGMLLDNSIVVLENISRYREMGDDILNAARRGTTEVGTAVTASTLTTIAVFFPLVFVKGIAGQLFKDQALTITFALMVSLVVALTLIPMLASTGQRKKLIEDEEIPKKNRKGVFKIFGFIGKFIFTLIPVYLLKFLNIIIGGITWVVSVLIKPFIKGFSLVYEKIEHPYPKFLKWALGHRGWVLLTALILLGMSLMMVPQLGMELIPQLAQGELKAEFRLPPGTPLEKTDHLIRSVQTVADQAPEIKNTFGVAGSGNRFDANPDQGGENWGELSITMKRGSGQLEEEQVMEQLRSDLGKRPGLQYKFYRPTLFSFKTPIEIEVTGYNLLALKRVSNRIKGKMEANPRFTDVKSTMEAGNPEIQIHFDREKAASLGLNVYQVAERVVSKVRGTVATRYSFHDKKIDMLVRAREADRSSLQDIKNLIVNPDQPRPVPLESIARIQVTTGPSEIRRIDQERVTLITANLRHGDLGRAVEDIYAIIGETEMPEDMVATVSGQNEEMKISFDSLKFALLLAIFLVYLVMASQFESFIHPLVIIFTIPLALIGAIFALWVTGSKISVVVFIGAILLAGIVVNNAIVLIDRINQLRRKGTDKLEAILQGGRSRLRPIVMTTLTTALGLLPMAIGLGEGVEIRAPMAITVIGGLIVSTLLTLIVIPVVYSLMDRKG